MAWLALLALLLLAQIIPLVAACGALAVLHAVVAYALIGALRAAQRVEQLWLQQQQQQQEHLYRDEEAWGSAAVPMAVSLSKRAGSASSIAVLDLLCLSSICNRAGPTTM